MSNKQRCSHLTRRGRRCRNTAAAGSDPPQCAYHLKHGQATPVKPGGFYFPEPAADVEAVEGEAADLRAEVVLVRVVLRRLLLTLDAGAEELPAEELRRIAGLVFAGARTVAHLLGQRVAQGDDAQQWLAAALAQMSADEPL